MFGESSVQVGSGGAKASASSASAALSKLPDMFVANLPATECSTAENEDFVYPNPGQSLFEGNGASLGDTLTGAGCTKQNQLGAGSGQIGSPEPGTPTQPKPSQSPVQSKPAVPSTPSDGNVPQPSNPGGVFAPGASSAPAAGPTAAPPSPPAQSEPTAAPIPPKDGNDTNAPITPVDGDCTPCTNDGAVVCIGSNQFGLCNRGCAVAQDLAAGMACSNGVVVAATKRSMNFPRAHIHRRHGSARFL